MKRRGLSVFGSRKNVSGSACSTVADRLPADAELLAQRAFRRETVSSGKFVVRTTQQNRADMQVLWIRTKKRLLHALRPLCLCDHTNVTVSSGSGGQRANTKEGPIRSSLLSMNPNRPPQPIPRYRSLFGPTLRRFPRIRAPWRRTSLPGQHVHSEIVDNRLLTQITRSRNQSRGTYNAAAPTRVRAGRGAYVRHFV